MVDRQRRQFDHAGLFKVGQQPQRQLFAGFAIDLPCLLVDDVLCNVGPHQIVGGNDDLGQPAIPELLGGARRHLAAGLGDHFAGHGIDQVIGQLGTFHPIGVERGFPALAAVGVGRRLVEVIEDLFGRHAAHLTVVKRLAVGLLPVRFGLH